MGERSFVYRFTQDLRLDDHAGLAAAASHGAVVPARLSGGALDLASPIRPVAPGQTVALYERRHPEVVVGAAVVAS